MSDPLPDSRAAVLYSRHGCSPCFAMQREAKRAARRTGIPLQVVEISGNAVLEERYGMSVPVLVMPGGETIQGLPAPGDIDSAFRRAAGSLSVRCHPSAVPGLATRRRVRVLRGFMSILGWPRRPQA